LSLVVNVLKHCKDVTYDGRMFRVLVAVTVPSELNLDFSLVYYCSVIIRL